MELHSYAKRKTYKKWSTEQKHKLVETRISSDAIFANYPSNSLLPWKKVLNLAKLDDYNVSFVRKQWSNMIAKYKQYKQTRLGNVSSRAIDDEAIRKIAQEWEFFYPIHRFMTHKTTNLHSYALTAQQEPSSSPSTLQQEHEQEHPRPLNSNSSTERINVFSSDTNEDFNAAGCSSNSVAHRFLPRQNTDHDFYSKSADAATVNGLNYFADASEDTQESMIVELTAPFIAHEDDETDYPTTREIFVGATAQIMETKLIVEEEQLQIKQEVPDVDEADERDKAAPQHPKNAPAQKQYAAQRSVKPKLSERDKYYRHKRRFNRRLEQRFDSILNVFGQIVKAEYPNIEVGTLLGAAATAAAATGGGAVAAAVTKLFSSDEDIDDSVDEDKMEEEAEEQHASTEAKSHQNHNSVQQPQE